MLLFIELVSADECSMSRLHSKTKKPPCWKASEKAECCKISIYLDRLFQEKGHEMANNKKLVGIYVQNKISKFIDGLFKLSPDIAQHFERPIMEPQGNDVSTCFDDVGDRIYVCRMFLKHATLPDSFKVSTSKH